MTIRVHINTDFTVLGSVRLWIADFDGERPRRFMKALSGETFQGPIWEDLDEATLAGTIPPTVTLPEDVARALVDALVVHFQGAEDTRRLRADYDAALRRADEKDKLIADVLRNITMGAAR